MQAALSSFKFESSGGYAYHAGGVNFIRDVQFDPFRPLLFAAALEDGSVQLWDVRKCSSPLLRFTAHSGLVTCLQWHPTQACVLATGSRDRMVKVWHLPSSASGERLAADSSSSASATGTWEEEEEASSGDAAAGVSYQLRPGCWWQPALAIQTLASVGKLAWRPLVTPTHAATAAAALPAPQRSDDRPGASSTDALFSAPSSDVDHHLATSAALLDNNVYVWDTRRPHVPVAIFSGHKDVATGIVWTPGPRSSAFSDAAAAAANTHHLPWLLSAGKDGRLLFHDPQSASRPHMDMRITSIALSASSIAWVGHQSLRRNGFWDPVEDVACAATTGDSTVVTTGMLLHEQQCDRGRSAADDPLLPPSFTVFDGEETISNGESTSFNTDPSAAMAAAVVAGREPAWMSPFADALVAFTPLSHVFAALALSYVTEGASVDTLCEYNADIAEQLGLHHLSQVWRTLAAMWGEPPLWVKPQQQEEEEARARLVGPSAEPRDGTSSSCDLTAAAGADAPSQTAESSGRGISAQHSGITTSSAGIINNDGSVVLSTDRVRVYSDAASAAGSDASHFETTLNGSTTAAIAEPPSSVLTTENLNKAVSPQAPPTTTVATPALEPSVDVALVSDTAASSAALKQAAHATPQLDASGTVDSQLGRANSASDNGRAESAALASFDSTATHVTVEGSIAADASSLSQRQEQQQQPEAVLRAGVAQLSRDGCPHDELDIISPAASSVPRFAIPLQPPSLSNVPGYIPGITEAMSFATPWESPFLRDDEQSTVSSSGGEEEATQQQPLSSAIAVLTSVPTVAAAAAEATTAATALSVLASSSAALTIATSAADGPSTSSDEKKPHANAEAEPLVPPTPTASSPPAAALPPISLEEHAAASWHKFRLAVTLELLAHYADRGDVQTCVTVCRALGVEVEEAVGQARLQQWLVQYIDLLNRLQLYSPASTVMARCHDKFLRRKNQENTTVVPSCSTCGTALEAPPPPPVVEVEGQSPPPPSPSSLIPAPMRCGKCARRLGTCAVFLLPVNGVFAWCQGCGHGGHLHHMNEWFEECGTLCPTGCGHVCNNLRDRER